jgi:hypothetical protein
MIIAASDEPLRNQQIYLKTISAFCARSNSGRILLSVGSA